MMLGVGRRCHQYGMSLALGASLPPTARSNCLYPHRRRRRIRLGYATLFPARFAGKLRCPGSIEAPLVSGIIPLLVIAGCLEGFFSPSQAPIWLSSPWAASLCPA